MFYNKICIVAIFSPYMSIFNQLGNFLSTVFVALLFNLTLIFVVIFNLLIGIHVKQKHIRMYIFGRSIN